MKRPNRLTAGAISVLAAAGGLAAAEAPVSAHTGSGTRHVLLLSIDGMHQSDLSQCIATGLCPNLAQLSQYGTTYSHAETSMPSDSSPGIVALATGADPKLSGVYYDDSYDRTMFTPPAQESSGTQDCSGKPGAEMQYFENLDVGAPTFSQPNGTRTIMNEAIDPNQVPRGIVNGQCVPVFPNDYMRNNSIFSVAHAAGLRTAWADKHPASNSLVAGRGTPDAVDDPFQTEINADIVPPTLTDTRGNTVTFPLPNPTGDPNGFFITDSVGNTEAYDQIKVDAVLNEVDGWDSGHTSVVGTPAIFGMNFQTVSVGQKLVDPVLSCDRNPSGALGPCDPNYFPGGYEPGSLAFTPQLQGAIRYVDAAIGSMVAELRSRGLLSSTDIVITAKHGQSPIDPSRLEKIGHAEVNVLNNAGITAAQVTDDDVALIWLADQSQTQAAVNALNADKNGANTARIQTVLSGSALQARFGDPAVDPRTPDLIVQPIPGTIYSSSGAKVAEHGGFAPDDTHVALLVVDGARMADQDQGGFTVAAPVRTFQVAPTILSLLGLDPGQLDSVRLEGVRVLPGLPGQR